MGAPNSLPQDELDSSREESETQPEQPNTYLATQTAIMTPEDTNTRQSSNPRIATTKKSTVTNKQLLDVMDRQNETLESLKKVMEMLASSVLSNNVSRPSGSAPFANVGLESNQNEQNQRSPRGDSQQTTQRSSDPRGSRGDSGSPLPRQPTPDNCVTQPDDYPRGDHSNLGVFKDSTNRSGSPTTSRQQTSAPQMFGDPQPPQLNNFAVINQIQPDKFDGDRTNARAWLRHYEETMEINGYRDEDKMKRARAYLRDEASQWLTTAHHLDPEMDWYCFKSRFLKHFCGLDGMAFLRRKLEEARQGSREHPSSYLVRIVDLCKEYKPNISDQEIVSKAAQGLSVASYNHLVGFRPLDQWTTKWMLEQFERLKAETAPRDASKSKKTQNSPAKKPRDLATWLCFNCNQKGHIMEDCSFPRDEDRIARTREEFQRSKQRNAEQSSAKKQADKRAVSSLKSARNQCLPPPVLACDSLIKPTLVVKLNGQSFSGRIDSGADITAIPGNVAKELGLHLVPWDQPALKGVGNETVQVLGAASVIVSHNEAKRALLVAVLPDNSLSQPLWGVDLLNSFAIQLNFGEPSDSVINVDAGRSVNLASNVGDELLDSHPIDKLHFGIIEPDAKKELTETLIEYRDVFSRDEHDIGRTSTIKHRIHLVYDQPVYKPPYRVAIRLKQEMEQTIKRLITTDAIRPSKSPYASPVFLIDKDGGKARRLVADYRQLNAKTVPDRTPMPHPEDVFTMLTGSRTFAKLDITAMFNQIEVDERDIEKTAIATPLGLYECPLMPFGLRNAPATAVKLMKEVLRDLDGKICFVYFDDIIIFAPDTSELVQRCTAILQRLRLHNLKLKPAKCIFGTDSVKFLGHKISVDGLEMDASRIEKVLNFGQPKNASDVRSFYGLCSYNRKFIRNFAAISKPLTPLMIKQSKFEWNPEAQKAFEVLRKTLTETPILVHFDPDADHELRTDASSYAIGAVLFQKHKRTEQTGVVLYFSKTLSQTQTRYSATERELLAAFVAITELKHYLLGKRFTLVTDHEALKSINTCKDPHHRLARWIAQLQVFDYVVVHRPGNKHIDADCMSRYTENRPADDNYAYHQQSETSRLMCQLTSVVEDENDQGDANVSESQPLARDEINSDDERTQSQTELIDADVDMHHEQRQDDFCKKIIDLLESTKSDSTSNRSTKNYTLIEGKLYRYSSNSAPTLVVPLNRRDAILLSCHDTPLAGHLGFSRTYDLIRSRFYWPKMRREIKKYVLSCHRCQRKKATNQRRQGFTCPLPIAENVFDTVGIDLITKLPESIQSKWRRSTLLQPSSPV